MYLPGYGFVHIPRSLQQLPYSPVLAIIVGFQLVMMLTFVLVGRRTRRPWLCCAAGGALAACGGPLLVRSPVGMLLFRLGDFPTSVDEKMARELQSISRRVEPEILRDLKLVEERMGVPGFSVPFASRLSEKMMSHRDMWVINGNTKGMPSFILGIKFPGVLREGRVLGIAETERRMMSFMWDNYGEEYEALRAAVQTELGVPVRFGNESLWPPALSINLPSIWSEIPILDLHSDLGAPENPVWRGIIHRGTGIEPAQCHWGGSANRRNAPERRADVGRLQLVRVQ